ncbi:sugar phosphate isomerase/epimerase family protein [Albidovulum sp.]
MRLSISNIAWAPEAAAAVYPRLCDAGVSGLEIAPGLLFPGRDPFAASREECREIREMIGSYGLQFTSMQSLLYGAEGAELFGPGKARRALAAGLERAIALAGRLGVPNLVFGSPGNRRIPEGLEAPESVWRPAFRALGDRAAAAGTVLALETNPAAYGTNFMVTLAETLAVARAVDHPAVRVNLDLGALILTGEIAAIDGWLQAALPLIHHVHLSAPHLAPIAEVETELRRLVSALDAAGYRGWYSVEMRAAPGALDAALALLERLHA